MRPMSTSCTGGACACPCSPPGLAQDHDAGATSLRAQALITWFECIECTDGELKALTSFGPAVEGALISTLRRGLSPAKRAQVERSFGPLTTSFPIEKGEYVEHLPL